MTSIRPIHREIITLQSGHAVELRLVPSTIPSAGNNKIAVLLHPWSWLGGNMNDPILGSFTQVLLDRRYHIITYNSRGVGKSSGWPSFSSVQEGKDLEDVVQWCLSHVPDVNDVLLLGYSHGSLIASLQPVLPSPIKTSHILLSYPLDKRGMLTLFNSTLYSSRLSSLLQNWHPAANVLLIFGDQDQFTSIENYRQWVNGLRKESKQLQGEGDRHGSFEVIEIAGAGHFWGGISGRNMLDRVAEWLDRESS
ncbi:alpha/beta-hydrolase [Rickenella mellea]|uniref:Alpha/beta-hydrolase n=1 Tax=Rickenella mellea TaxID=50990 RepID=A0A4Y7QFJ8_9AGAM|nr:alpha/beta-hydrolase [Rickenella mellea]